MSVTVTLPQLGESVTEGTITRWLKAVGDQVMADEPLVEVSTDKVDTEIPAPASGVLLSIAADEDAVVEVGGVLGVIGEPDEAGGAAGGAAPAAPAVEPAPEPEPTPEPEPAPVAEAVPAASAASALPLRPPHLRRPPQPVAARKWSSPSRRSARASPKASSPAG